MNAKRLQVVMATLVLVMTQWVGIAQAGETTRPPGVINVNTASAAQLTLLPGIGPKRAAQIVAFRQVKPFKRVMHLARVKGIGIKTVRKLRVYLTVTGPTTLSEAPPRRL